MRTLTGTLRGASVVAVGVLFATFQAVSPARADDAGIAGRFVRIGTTPMGKSFLTSWQVGPSAHFGTPTTDLDGRLFVYYVDAPYNRGSLVLPSPWSRASSTAVKLRNFLAPGGPTPVKLAAVVLGKAALVESKGLDTFTIDAPPGPNGVITILTLKNHADGMVHQLCTQYAIGLGSSVKYTTPAGNKKLVLRRGRAITCPTCSDGTMNGDETGIDCGGDTCPRCPVGAGCIQSSDCASDICPSGLCLPSCHIDGAIYPAFAVNDDCGMCDPSVSTTSWSHAPDFLPCADGGSKCTSDNVCGNGVCRGTITTDCEGPNMCSFGRCDESTGDCVAPVQYGCSLPTSADPSCFGASCDLQTDRCVMFCLSGTCGTGTPGCGMESGCTSDADCSGVGGSPCFFFTCDTNQGLCVDHRRNCGDGDDCTTDYCVVTDDLQQFPQGFECRHINPPPLGLGTSDGVACTEETCEQVHNPNAPGNIPRDSWCDDGDPCTVDSCTADPVANEGPQDTDCAECGVCSKVCTTDADCPGRSCTGGVCSKSCTSNADCDPQKETCKNGLCVDPCASDAECGPGGTCLSTLIGYCRPVCVVDGDCPAGTHCNVYGSCATTCTTFPGDDGMTGTGVDDDCPANYSCGHTETTATCYCQNDAACAPGEKCHVDGRCTKDCTANVDCRTGETCVFPKNTCMPGGVCTPGDPTDPCVPGSCRPDDYTSGCHHTNACDDGDPDTTDLCHVKIGGGIACGHLRFPLCYPNGRLCGLDTQCCSRHCLGLGGPGTVGVCG